MLLCGLIIYPIRKGFTSNRDVVFQLVIPRGELSLYVIDKSCSSSLFVLVFFYL